MLLLSFLLFVPTYAFNASGESFLPSHFVMHPDHPWWQGLVVRSNLDIFRLSGEWLLLATLALPLLRQPWGRRLWLWTATPVYLLLMTYQIYYAAIVRIYGQHPQLRSDLVLAREVLPTYLDQITGGSPLVYVGGAVALAVVVALAVLLLRAYLRVLSRVPSYRPAWVVLAVAWVYVLGCSWLGREMSYRADYFSVQWTSGLLARSWQMEDVDKIKRLPGKIVYENYGQMPLAHKPDIYLLFVESYGRAIATKYWMRPSYEPVIRRLSDSLRLDGWHSRSAYSLAPILGGKSWLSFTTVMSGVKIDNQVHFNDLLDLHTDYPGMTRYFRGQGYKTYRMKTFSQQKASTEEAYAQQDAFFRFDQWVKHHDIPYRGFMYDFHGGIPDQYALGYLRDVVADTTQPLFAFFITMASHVPWFPPPPVVADWRQLDEIQQDPYNIYISDTIERTYDQFMVRLEGAKMGERYMQTIFYDLEAIAAFVRSGPPDAIYLVLGDHQPPALTYYGGDGLEVPVHVISRDTAFLSGWEAFGFREGMEADTTLPAPVNHEGLYSILMRTLLDAYGVPDKPRPVYLPNGI
ncbi:MAG: hypothetical protein OHK0039_04330 [Bacteroidia bacterium]